LYKLKLHHKKLNNKYKKLKIFDKINFISYSCSFNYITIMKFNLPKSVENAHLPDVPSETEVTENGLSLGESYGTLLRKIEELTLYMLELKKENEELRQMIENTSN